MKNLKKFLRKPFFWISATLHALILVVLGSCIVARSPEKKPEIVAEIQMPLFTEEKEELSETSPESGGGNEKELPPIELPDRFVSVETITAKETNAVIMISPILGTMPQLGRSGSGSGDSSGIGRGHGNGIGTGNLGGMQVPLSTVVIMDVSGSIFEYDRVIYFYYAKNFPNARLVTTQGCKTFTIHEAIRYVVEELRATSIYLFTDFKDDGDAKYTLQAVEIMQRRNVKLFICTADKPAYRELGEYARVTGEVKQFAESFR